MRIMNKKFIGCILKICLPMILQNLINISLQAADIIMIGRLGEEMLSGASLASQVYFVLNIIIFGVCSGIVVLISQYRGQENMDVIDELSGMAFRINIIAGIIFCLIAFLFPMSIMGIFTDDLNVLYYGCRYLRICSFVYPVLAFVMTYLAIIKTMEKMLISTIIYIVSLLINIIFNALLIFGLMGFPKLGVEGAAYATVIARITELIIIIFYARYINSEMRVKIRYIIKTSNIIRKDAFKIILPVLINELIWGLACSVNAAIIGHMGSRATAAYSVAMFSGELVSIITYALACSTSIILGREIGAGNMQTAEKYGRNFVYISVIFGIVSSSFVIFLKPTIIKWMNFSYETEMLSDFFLNGMFVYCILQAIDEDCIVGIFRAGGDTRSGLIIDAVSMWGISIPLGFLAAFVFGLSSKFVFLILLSNEVFKMPAIAYVYRKKNWLNAITRDKI